MTATAQDNSLHMKERFHIVKEPDKLTSAFAQIEDGIAAIRAGQMVIVVDDEDRENEGDLTIAAEKITPQAIIIEAKEGTTTGFLPPIVLRRCLRRLIRRRSLRISFVLATCSRCVPGALECWPALDKRKRP